MVFNVLQAHLNNLQGKSKQMVVEVNRAIGQSICMDNGGVLVASSAAVMYVNGNQVSNTRPCKCY